MDLTLGLAVAGRPELGASALQRCQRQLLLLPTSTIITASAAASGTAGSVAAFGLLAPALGFGLFLGGMGVMASFYFGAAAARPGAKKPRRMTTWKSHESSANGSQSHDLRHCLLF